MKCIAYIAYIVACHRLHRAHALCLAAFLFTPCQGWLLPPRIAPSPQAVPTLPAQPPVIAHG